MIFWKARSARWACEAQSDDRQEARSTDHAAGKGAETQPWQRLLPAASRARGRSRHHATHGRVASRVSLRGQPDAARSPECRGLRDRPPACRNPDEADGDRGDLSQAEHEQTNAGAQDLSVSPAQAADRPPEPGLGDRYHLHPDGAQLRLSHRRGFSRRVLSWRVSITMEAEFCIEEL